MNNEFNDKFRLQLIFFLLLAPCLPHTLNFAACYFTRLALHTFQYTSSPPSPPPLFFWGGGGGASCICHVQSFVRSVLHTYTSFEFEKWLESYDEKSERERERKENMLFVNKNIEEEEEEIMASFGLFVSVFFWAA